MAKLQRTQMFPATSKIKDGPVREFADKLIAMLDALMKKIASIPFNQSEYLSVASTGNADTEFSIDTHIGRVPAGYILTKTDRACCIYTGSTAWTANKIYLKCNVDNAVITIAVF
jgi:hypothetical protein